MSGGGMVQMLLSATSMMGMQAGTAMPRSAGMLALVSGAAQIAMMISSHPEASLCNLGGRKRRYHTNGGRSGRVHRDGAAKLLLAGETERGLDTAQERRSSDGSRGSQLHRLGGR